MQSLLEKFGVKYEDLNPAEKETLREWQKSLETRQITLEGVKDYVRNLVEAVERELADTQESTSIWSWLSHRKKDIFLKGRLKNYLMLHDFLSGPDKARKYIEQSLNNIK
jgi:hypothetical protein